MHSPLLCNLPGTWRHPFMEAMHGARAVHDVEREIAAGA